MQDGGRMISKLNGWLRTPGYAPPASLGRESSISAGAGFASVMRELREAHRPAVNTGPHNGPLHESERGSSQGAPGATIDAETEPNRVPIGRWSSDGSETVQTTGQITGPPIVPRSGFDQTQPWPTVGGIAPNPMGPFHTSSADNLPADGIGAGGGRYWWPGTGQPVPVADPKWGEPGSTGAPLPDKPGFYEWTNFNGSPTVGGGDPSLANVAGGGYSAGQGFLVVMLEARNSNWSYARGINDIPYTYLNVDPRYLRAHFNDPGFNPYNYLGIPEEYRAYIPEKYQATYKPPEEMLTAPGVLPDGVRPYTPDAQLYGYANGWYGLPHDGSGSPLNPDGSHPLTELADGTIIPDWRDWQPGDPIPQYPGGPSVQV